MKVGVICAMTSEYDRLALHLSEARSLRVGLYEYVEGRLGDNTIILTLCGIGKVNAALGTSWLISSFSPECIVSTGVAGGVDTSLNVADVVAGAQVVYHDVWCGEGNAYGQVQGMPAMYAASEPLLRAAIAIDGEDGVEGHVRPGLICTGDRFVTRPEEVDIIKSHFPEALAVDMESAAIAQVCCLYGVPFISFRIISDTPGAEGHWQQYENFWKTMADRSFCTTRRFLEELKPFSAPSSHAAEDVSDRIQ